MPHEFDAFEPAFPRSDNGSVNSQPLPRRKSVREEIAFEAVYWLFITPIVCAVHTVAVARGLRSFSSLADIELGKLSFTYTQHPFPSIGLDAGKVSAIAIYFAIVWLWVRIFFWRFRRLGAPPAPLRSRLVTWAVGLVCLSLISLDGGLVYFGLKTQLRGFWPDGSTFLIPAATLGLCAGVALAGWIRVDHRTSTIA